MKLYLQNCEKVNQINQYLHNKLQYKIDDGQLLANIMNSSLH